MQFIKQCYIDYNLLLSRAKTVSKSR